MFVNSDFNLTGIRIISANVLRYSPINAQIQRHNRKRWALALKREGRTYYTANGKTAVSDASHIALLSKGSSYSWTCVEAGECLMIEFDADQTGSEVYSFPMADNSLFLSTFFQVRKSLYFPSPEASLESSVMLYSLLLQLIRSSAGDPAPKKKQQLLQPALDYIAERYHEGDITNDKLADLCAISTVYFRKIFKETFDVSPIRYLHELRMQKAKDLLSSDFISIAQVAQCVGCGDIFHFSKMFKSYTGLSPTQYAAMCRK